MFACSPLYVKICGITQPHAALAIAQMGVDALGFICVEASPRYVLPDRLQEMTAVLPPQIDRIGVFLNRDLDSVVAIAKAGALTGVQLHGEEPPEFCDRLRQAAPQLKIVKALRVRDRATLALARAYEGHVDVLLLDAYDPQQAGGTGKTLDWQLLQGFRSHCPWWLAGGLTPSNAAIAIARVHPQGIDVASGVELRPGIKDLAKVRQLLAAVRGE